MSNKIKIIFIGTSEFGVPSLEALIKDNQFEVVQVITQPDNPVGRKQILTPPPVKKIAVKNQIIVSQPPRISNSKFQVSNIDLTVLISYSQIIPKKLLEAPKYGAINVHGSLLPKFRGASCIQYPIIEGHKTTGITIMKMDEGLDTGPIITQHIIDIENTDTTGSLHDKLARLSGDFLVPSLKAYINGDLRLREQNHKQASYCKKLKKQDGQIDWDRSAEEIERFIRAMTPWPGAFGNFRMSNLDFRIIKILKAKHTPLIINKYNQGQFFINNNKLAVQCGKDALVINKLQLEGKKPITAQEFINGYKHLL